ncbi:tRNA (adenosine(37)-N6)-threonylcarbamoyltransferase complex transferase subunit TsaD [Candidatus Peregrinibacteria bacterium CG11_big_fil_rev_8_21_14_0_20_46_8]|nr:MAG: tRNA (adenosine(37)-N6)-threonylcarbamoyltransferase complex transferase subunit TsaD [Candidatus Peregrinibacteria bacterium CG11_big_fil_rev_8_21_14_0_20_46_8]
MLILGIETSCDETSVAVVKNGRLVLSNIISSQIDLHRKTGGVVPEVAAREHVVRIVPVIEEALKKARLPGIQRSLQLSDIDAIAVTYGPGLLSSLLTGVSAAMTLAKVLNVPLIPVNHIAGHISANFLVDAQDIKEGARLPPAPKFPAVVLTASGGHNELVLWHDHGKYTFLGATLDDAAGEAFDKVARMLGLPYPGGPSIQKAAQAGDPTRYPLPLVFLEPWPLGKKSKEAVQKAVESGHSTKANYNWNFSFSGLKTAVRNLTYGKRRTKRFIADVAASFQEVVCHVLAEKLVRAAQIYKVNEVHLAGGVSANSRLRELVAEKVAIPEIAAQKIRLRYCSSLQFCTDNAAMIASAGYFLYKKEPAKYKKWQPIEADPNLKLQKK